MEVLLHRRLAICPCPPPTSTLPPLLHLHNHLHSTTSHAPAASQHRPTRLWYKHVSTPHPCDILTKGHALKKRGQIVKATVESKCSETMQSIDQSPQQLTLNDAITQSIFLKRVEALYRFTRPYSISATVIGVISVSLLALQSYQEISLHFVVEVARAIISLVLMHIYIVGINQVVDVEIDKVNKPSLPLASGALSLKTGIFLTSLCAILSFTLGSFVASKYLSWALIFGFILGTGYSLDVPLLRWKKWGLATAITITLYRTIVVQICTFLHMQTFVLKRPATLNKPMIFLTAFTCILSSAIALIKDIPDLEGDKAHGMQTFVVQLGPERVFRFCINVLMAAYGVAIIVGLTSNIMWARIGTVIGHAIAAGALWSYTNRVDLKDKTAMYGTYMDIWNLFKAELFLVQLVR